jgi:hypothetical protein
MSKERPILKRFKSEVDYYRTHRDDLLQQYPEEWVAIFNQTVVAADAEPEKLLAALRQKGVPVEQALVEHLTRHEDTLIL